MIAIQPLSPDDIPALAAMLARRQQSPPTHIGFCGALADEIAAELRQLEPDAAQTFVVAWADGRIVGAMGADISAESGRGFVWGPIAEVDDQQALADRMWLVVEPLIPAGITRLDIFCNMANAPVREWAPRHGFAFRDEHSIMAFERDQAGQLAPSSTVAPLDPAGALAEAFAALHDATFPRTYYSGREILAQINEHQQVFVVAAPAPEDGLLGYAYVEVKPEYGEASIEFIGVSERARGQRIGAALLGHALGWMFAFPTVESTELVVDGTNAAAQRLYRRVGFGERYHMASYRRDKQ